MNAIKIGNERVLLNSVTHVSNRTSDQIQIRKDGTYFEDYYGKDEDKYHGLVVTVYFISASESPDYVRFFNQDAEEFLKRFDALTKIEQLESTTKSE